VVVSFKAPENLVVTIENDLKFLKVNIKATADYALFYDVYFGEAGKPMPNAVMQSWNPLHIIIGVCYQNIFKVIQVTSEKLFRSQM
jgi:hypothetical protein